MDIQLKVSYRVPTGVEVASFVELINAVINRGDVVTYVQSGAEWRVSRVRVLDLGFPAVEVVTWCGLPLPTRDALLLSADSFAFKASLLGLGKDNLLTPVWLEKEFA